MKSAVLKKRGFSVAIIAGSYLTALFISNFCSAASAYPDSYDFSFSDLTPWVVSGSGVSLVSSGTASYLGLSSTGTLSSITYNEPIALQTSYRLKFRAMIGQYASGWPLRVVIKSGSVNTYLVFTSTGIKYRDVNNTLQTITGAPAVGAWHDYDLKVTRNYAVFSMDGGTAISLPSLLQGSGAQSLEISASATTSGTTLSSEVDHLEIIPDPITFSEEWANLSQWTTSGAGTYTLGTLSTGETYLQILGNGGSSSIKTVVPNLPTQYSIRYAGTVNAFNGATPLALLGGDGNFKFSLFIQSDGSLQVFNASNVKEVVPGITIAAGARFEFEVTVDNGVAELYELSASGAETYLYTWGMPTDTDADNLYFYTYGTGCSANVYYVNVRTEVPLVALNDKNAVSGAINLPNGEVFGIDLFGGGYGSSLILAPGGSNIIETGFGAGWIDALRSNLHIAQYNPTQAGASDVYGAQTELLPTASGFNIKAFAAPLFLSSTYDFVENQPDGTDGTDVDGINESNLSWLDEIRSETDYSGSWENASGSTGISVLKHTAKWLYARPPAAILQFNRESGAINETYRVADLSPSHYSGSQTGTDEDICYLLNTYSYRLDPSVYKYIMWKESGVWKSVLATTTVSRVGVFGTNNDALNTGSLGTAPVTYPSLADKADSGVIVLSKTGGADDPAAIGLYYPYGNAVNAASVNGQDRVTGAIIFTEDRRINSYYESYIAGSGASTKLVVFLRMWHLGLMSPDYGSGTVAESVNLEVYQLIGTPNQIYTKAISL